MKKNDVGDNDDENENEKCERTHKATDRYGADTWPSQKRTTTMTKNGEKKVELKMNGTYDRYLNTKSKIECRFKV